tara:strand:+ start:179 stop:1006 length:828 start_codon:yes stop_codon:yes gene_type:complete
MNKKLIVTGGTGFVGRLFLSNLSLQGVDVICVGRKKGRISQDYNQITFEEFSNTFYPDGQEIYVLHLATFYSKLDEERENIKSAFDFSMNILNFVKKSNLINFLYTNTMFIFDEIESEYYYTKSKKLFSENLHSTLNNDQISEIFLSDTFHINDQRNKVVPMIKKAILKKEQSPVQNKDKYINLVYGGDLIRSLESEVFNSEYSKSRITSKVDLKINSIYEFLKCLNETGKINKFLIDSKNSYYETKDNIPKINKHFNESDILEKLSTLITVKKD